MEWETKTRVLFHSGDIFLIPFGILWCGMVSMGFYGEFSNACKNRQGLDLIGLAFFGLFILIGLYFVFGRFIVDAKLRAKTFYAVTNERILIITSGLFRQTTKSLNLRTLTDISLTEKGDKYGTITFGHTASGYMWWNAQVWPGMPKDPMFEMIENAKGVYDTIINAQKESQKP